MSESDLLFNLCYTLLILVIVYPPLEFQLLGLTIEQLFSRYLGKEHLNFVHYHRKRTSLNFFIYSCLPSLYFLFHRVKYVLSADYAEDSEDAAPFQTLTWKIAERFSLMAMLATPCVICKWSNENWRRHPITRTLLRFSNVPNNAAGVISDIGNEFRRPDIYKRKLNAISYVIATENWIIKTSTFFVDFAHQSDTTLSVNKTEVYNITQDINETLQMVSITVKTNRPGTSDFGIRINALEFRNLEERMARPIVIPSNIQFHRNVTERFIDVFKQQVSLNPTYRADRLADKCFACMMAKPNIKIYKQCVDVDRNGSPLPAAGCCTDCYCRPMWCVECLARWFAARQEEYEREVWLEQKCTCPMCRAKFCILDVSYVEDISMTNHDSSSNDSE